MTTLIRELDITEATMKRTDKRTKDTPQLMIDGDTGELYTPLGMLKKEWADAVCTQQQ